MKGGVLRLMKLWGGSSRRAISKKDSIEAVVENAVAQEDEQKIIGFETLLSWCNENNRTDADGQEWNDARKSARKQKAIKFLTL